MPKRTWQIIGMVVVLVATGIGSIAFASTYFEQILQSPLRGVLTSLPLPLIGAFLHLRYERCDDAGRRCIERCVEWCFAAGAVLFVSSVAFYAAGTRVSWLRQMPWKSITFVGVVGLEIAISFGGLEQIKRWCHERYELWLTAQQIEWRKAREPLLAERARRAEALQAMKISLAVLQEKQAASDSYIQAIGQAAAKISPPTT